MIVPTTVFQLKRMWTSSRKVKAKFCLSSGCEFVLKLKAINCWILILCLALLSTFRRSMFHLRSYFRTTVTYKPPILQIPDIAVGENVFIYTTAQFKAFLDQEKKYTWGPTPVFM